MAHILVLCAVVLLAVPKASVAQEALDSRLRSLDTIEAGRGWDAVGRLDHNGEGFCTGALIAPDLVLTAAHCLFDRRTKTELEPSSIEFLAGFRRGRASAYRTVSRAVIHPSYEFEGDVSTKRVRHDIALLQLQRPIRNTSVTPFQTDIRPRKGAKVGVISYAHDRLDAPSLQEVCGVMARQDGVLIMSCEVDYGASGAPVFSFDGGEARIVSVVSAKARVGGQPVSLGAALSDALAQLRSQLEGAPGLSRLPTGVGRAMVGGVRNETGAKFIRQRAD